MCSINYPGMITMFSIISSQHIVFVLGSHTLDDYSKAQWMFNLKNLKKFEPKLRKSIQNQKSISHAVQFWKSKQYFKSENQSDRLVSFDPNFLKIRH